MRFQNSWNPIRRLLSHRRARPGSRRGGRQLQLEGLEMRLVPADTPIPWPQPGGQGSLVTIPYSYSNLFDGGLGLPAWQMKAAIEEALGRWAEVAPLSFVEVPDRGPAPDNSDTNYPATCAPLIRFGHHGPLVDDKGNALAHGYYPQNPKTSGLAGDVHFDNTDTWTFVMGASGVGFLETAVHEIGHAIGLVHEETNPAIMNPAVQDRFRSLGTSFLFPDDRDAVRDLYGTGAGAVSPLTLDQRFRGTHDYASAFGYVGGFPNFHEADYGTGMVYGTTLIKSGMADRRDVAISELGVGTDPTQVSATELLRAVDRYAQRTRDGNGQLYAGGFPNFHGTDNGDGRGFVYGTILLKAGTLERRFIPAHELGVRTHLPLAEIDALFRGVNDYAGSHTDGQGRPFSGALPTYNWFDFHNGREFEVAYETLLLKESTATWRDVPDTNILIPPLHIQGGPGPDTFHVRVHPTSPDMVQVFLNDPTFSRPPIATHDCLRADRILISGLGGDDTLIVDDSMALVTTSIDFDGGLNSDRIIVQGGTSNDVYLLSEGRILRDVAAEITYTATEDVTINVGTVASTVTIEGTAATTPVTIHSGPQADTIVISPVVYANGWYTNNLDRIRGAISLTGNTDTDSLMIFDEGNPRNDVYTLGALGMSRTLAAPLTYGPVADLTLYAGYGNNTVQVTSTALNSSVLVIASASGNVVVGDDANRLDVIRGDLTIDGRGWTAGTGANLSIKDQGYVGDFLPGIYTVTDGTVTSNRAAPINYFSVNNLTLNGGRGYGGNTISIQSTPANSRVRVNSGPLNDTVYVGTSANQLDSIRGDLTIDGQGGPTGGGATLYLNDQGYVGLPGSQAGSFFLTDRDVTSNRSAPIKYVGVYDVTLNGGRAFGGNSYFVRSTLAGSRVRVNTGPLNDNAYVGSTGNRLDTIRGDLTIDGQGAPGNGGVDLRFNDSGTTVGQTYTLTATDFRSLVAARTTFLGASVTINAGLLGDTLNVQGTPVGMPVTFNASGGGDTVTGPSAANAWALSSNNYGTLNGTITLNAIETLNGGSMTDALTGPNLPNAWTLTGNTSGTFNNGAVAFTSMERIHGGSNTDSLTGPNAVNAWTLTSNNNGSLNNSALTFTSIDTLVGGNQADTLIGPNLATSWVIQASNLGYLNSNPTFVTPLSFKAVENLTGGTSIDNFVFAGGSVTGTLDGKDGWDTLNFSGSPNGASVSLSGLGTRDGFNGSTIGDISRGFFNVNEVIATSRAVATYLVGPNLAATWDLTSFNAGVVLVGTLNRINFANFKNLTGGSSNDTFRFSNGTSMLLSGNLNGGGGLNTLDYSQHSNLNPVSVDLAFGQASRVNGVVNGIQNVTGGAGNDTLTGNTADNVLVGGAGDDTLADYSGGYDIFLGGAGNDRITGGFGVGRSLMVGGSGADQLIGTGSDDILIGGLFGGTSPYYNEATGALNLTALNAIMLEWKSSAFLDTRIGHLETASGGLNGSHLLNASTVLNDNAVDTLTGGIGGDWFLYSLGDLLQDFTPGTDRKKQI